MSVIQAPMPLLGKAKGVWQSTAGPSDGKDLEAFIKMGVNEQPMDIDSSVPKEEEVALENSDETLTVVNEPDPGVFVIPYTGEVFTTYE